MDKIKDHLGHNTLLNQQDVADLLKDFPQYQYKGIAYRVLLSTEDPKDNIMDVSKDVPFSSSLNGILHYTIMNADDYYHFAQLYKVDLIGLDLKQFAIDNNIEVIKEEDEVLASKVFKQSLVLSTNIDSFIEHLEMEL